MTPKNQRWWLTADHVELDIEASADAVYAMISDLPRIGAWSPECESVEWEGDVTVPVEGTTFVGHNAWDPGDVSAIAPWPGAGRRSGVRVRLRHRRGRRESTVWRYQFVALGDGRTRVTEGYEVRWIPTWARILDVPTNRHKDLLKGMRTTLERLKADRANTAAHQFRRGPRRDPVMTTCFTAAPGVDVITTTADIPALGSLAINAFVLHGNEPVLVDIGTVAGCADFISG